MKIKQATEYIQTKLKQVPKVGMILGSGLGEFAEDLEDNLKIPYQDIPHFPQSTAPGHKGNLIAGSLHGKSILCMQGRQHFYEGYSMEDISLPIRCMKKLGVNTLILTNAAGGLNPSFQQGDFMLITDHINFMGTNPLIGKNNSEFGPRFCDMTQVYDVSLQELCKKTAQKLQIPLKTGVYLACTGPSYETPAEIRMFQAFGGDAVGMSTVPEAIIANHCQMKILAISCISNMGAGMEQKTLCEEEVIEITSQKTPLLKKLIREILMDLDE